MILNRRILRDLKQNFVRYFAVFVVIAISMYVVVGMAGSADTVMDGVRKHAEANAVEDGQFTVFVPLNDEEAQSVVDLGVIIEEHFYVDFSVNDSTLRVFENRETVDKLELDEGRCASADNEIALEKHYCRANGIELGDIINIAGIDFEVVGIGSTPDYDDVLENLTDATSNALLFGTAFVTEKGYDNLRESGKALSAESVQYAYRITGTITQDELREELSKMEFALDSVTDEFAYDYFCDVESVKDDFSNSVQEVSSSSQETADAAVQLADAIAPYGSTLQDVGDSAEKLSESANDLKKGAEKLLSAFSDFSDEYLDFTYSNLKEFVEAGDNPRINASADDIQVNKSGALIAGVIILVLLAYVLSAFVTNTIDRESKVIGTLYSLGFLKSELTMHFTILPVMVSLIGGITGTWFGFRSIRSQMAENCGYFSYPYLDTVYSPYLIVYGVVVPFVMAIVVNVLFINRKLSQEPLALMRKQRTDGQGRTVKLGKLNFISVFRIKLFVREIKSNLTISAGMFIALLLVMLALCIYSALTNIVTETERDVNFEYMYHLSYPEDSAPENAEKAYIKKLNKAALGYDFNVSILGIDPDSEAFPYDINANSEELYISTSVAEKFGVQVGDEFDLTDKINNVRYIFKVKKIVSYAPGLFVFMDMDEMRDRFDQDEGYYNILLAQVELDIETGRIYATTTKQEICDSSEMFMTLMERLIYVLVAASAALFILVMYLMVKMIIERQTSNISMFKVFGYTKGEISKLYLRNTLYTVIVSGMVFIPATKLIIEQIYPYLVANRAVGFNLSFSDNVYLFIWGLIVFSYLIAYILAKIKLNRINIQTILKDRE